MSVPTTMQAARIHAYGGPERIVIETMDVPEPGPGEVLVAVHAASVNGADLQLRENGFNGSFAPPFTLGMDLSGVVVARAEGVDGVAVGSRVHGRHGSAARGTFASFVAIAADELVTVPDTLDDTVAAAIPVVGLAAWQSLFDLGELQAGQRVLIQGAGGSVGHLAVQLAKEVGAYVIASDGGHALERLRSLGADEVHDHRETDVVTVIEPVDLVLDTVGGPVTDASLPAVRDGGRLVTLAGDPDRNAAAQRDVTAQMIDSWMDREDLVDLDARLVDGRLTLDIAEIVPLDASARAHELAAEGHGKVVVLVAH